jgi:serine/threonine protein phosphatase PrpC
LITFLRRLRPAQALPSGVSVQSTGRTHVGHIRSVNEDRIFDRPDLGLWAVADGMGGHSHGDVAAETAIGHLARLSSPIDTRQIVSAVEQANRQIFQDSSGQSGTTLVVLLIEKAKATVWWAGDSRAYLIRAARLLQLTRDHSLVQDLVDAGLVDPKDAESHPQSNVITRALGTASQIDLESLTLELEPGDRLLLCSDGLSRTMQGSDVIQASTIDAQADFLIAQSLFRDGSDNTSLITVQLTTTE